MIQLFRQQIKTAEGDEEDEEPENEEMLMPKVKVAEDGSIILDEERCCTLLISFFKINILFLKLYDLILYILHLYVA